MEYVVIMNSYYFLLVIILSNYLITFPNDKLNYEIHHHHKKSMKLSWQKFYRLILHYIFWYFLLSLFASFMTVYRYCTVTHIHIMKFQIIKMINLIMKNQIRKSLQVGTNNECCICYATRHVLITVFLCREQYMCASSLYG